MTTPPVERQILMQLLVYCRMQTQYSSFHADTNVNKGVVHLFATGGHGLKGLQKIWEKSFLKREHSQTSLKYRSLLRRKPRAPAFSKQNVETLEKPYFLNNIWKVICACPLRYLIDTVAHKDKARAVTSAPTEFISNGARVCCDYSGNGFKQKMENLLKHLRL